MTYGRNKIIVLDDRFSTGEPTVQPVILWGLRSKPCYESLSKEASASPAYDYIKSVQPVPGRTIVLIIGLGSYEWYGLNRNGDGFPEQPYKMGVKPTCGCCDNKNRDAWILPEECIQYHYKSYEQGHCYLHHANKDPKRAVGKVLKAFWNSYMHRVEVLQDIDNAKAPHIVERIADGELLAASMGCRIKNDVCCLVGTLVFTIQGQKPIECIQPEDLVLTHTGVFRSVTKTFATTSSDGYIKLRTHGTVPIKVTPEHPFYVLREVIVRTCQGSANGKKLRHQIAGTSLCRRCNKTVDWHPSWISAKELCLGDYLLSPIPKTNPIITPPLHCARLLGYYIGNGSIQYSETKQGRNARAVQISLNANYSNINQRIINLLTQLVGKDKYRIDEHPEKNEMRIRINDRKIAEWLLKYGGQYSHSKTLNREIYQWPIEDKLDFLGGYIDTDGAYDADRCLTRLSSINRGLLLDVQKLAHTLNMTPSLYYGNKSTNTGYKPNTTCWSLFFNKTQSGMLHTYADKIINDTSTDINKSISFLWNNFWCTPITTLEYVDIEAPVYNLSVEEDESYVIENIVSHNCTVCGHMAPTRKHYCDHLKWSMGQLDPNTGIRYGALNPSPRFFDSSWVLRPADRTGYMLKKVATAYELQDYNSSALGDLVDDLNTKAAAARKLADMDKVVRGYPASILPGPETSLVQQYRDTHLPTVVENTTTLSHNDLKTLTPYRLVDTLAALSDAGIILTTPEFVQLFIEKALPGTVVPSQVLENLTVLQSEIFDLLSQHPSLFNELTSSFETERPQQQETLAKTIQPLMEKRSTLQEYLLGRLKPSYLSHDAPPQSELLEVVDPESGRVYQTTRGAAQTAQTTLDKNKLLRLGGGAGMLAAAYKILKSMPGRLKMWGLPIGASGAYLTHSAFGKDPMYQTTGGEQVPYLTEFVEKQGSLIDTVNTLGLDYNITKTGHSLFEKVAARTNHEQPLYLFAKKIASFGLYYPKLTLDYTIREQDKIATDGITEGPIDFDKIATTIGMLIWEIT
ncbi:MAG: LAGLIDADG family homing endonuclease [Desulfobacteraceae bacterium]|jgi:intein/homing endonuclease